jgi:hypothetical protein
MFIKACLVSIVVLLTAILMTQRTQKVVHAQGSIEYKVVDVEVFLTADGKINLTEGVKYLSTQDALNEYGKNRWELVSAVFGRETQRNGRLIFMRK